MKTVVAILIAVILSACDGQYHVGQMVETKVDHRQGMIISRSAGGYYTVRFGIRDTARYYDFELKQVP